MTSCSPPSPVTSTIRFGEPQRLSPSNYTAPFSHNISPDGKALTVLFSGGMDASLGAEGMDSIATVAMICIPITVPMPLTETFLGHHVTMRGFIQKVKGFHASVFIELGGATRTIEYHHSRMITEDIVEQVFHFSPDHPNPPAGHLTALIVLTLTRVGATEGDALLRIDAIDVEINKVQQLPAGT